MVKGCIIFLFVIALSIPSVGFSSKNIPVGYQYTSPGPDATHVPLESTIILRFEDGRAIKTNPRIEVSGTKSGVFSGDVKRASDGHTIIYTPHRTFNSNERINVKIIPAAQDVPSFSYSFKTLLREEIARPFSIVDERENNALSDLAKTNSAESARIMPNGVSVPDDFPHVSVPVSKETADGYIFINNWRDDAPYNIIYDNDGSPVWYERQARGDRRRDFKVQKNGTISMLTRQGGERFLGYDQNFNLIDEYTPAEPYSNDEHEFQILENGHYLMLGRRYLTLDWSKVVPGGQKEISVREITIQEFTPDHELIFNWPALEHFDPNDVFDWCERNEADPTSNNIRFPHMNSIDIDYDGHILVSSRHISEVTKINRQTGEIIWRLGGANNQFEFINDELDGFYMQHDIRSLGDNHYTIFDNGNLHSPQQSRAVEYVLDPENKTATLVWEFRGPPENNYYTRYMGNAQRLPNGNTLINFVEENNPKAIEVTKEGEIVFEMNFVDGYDTYRTFRFPWDGIVETPRLYLEQDAEKAVLLFNKFGDKNVAYYNIYSGTAPNPTTVLDTSRATMKTVTGLENLARHYFRVTAVNVDGEESDYSNQVDMYVKIIEPGQNMVSNGDFSGGLDEWNFIENWGADAEAEVTTDGECHIDITDGRNFSLGVQLVQPGMALTRGKDYRFEFDAYAAENRTIEAQVARTGWPQANYSQTGPIALRRAKEHFSFDFNMRQASDPEATLIFNCGGANDDVFFDNISLKEIVDDKVVSNSDYQIPHKFDLLPAFPNPFNPSTTITYVIPEHSIVQIYVYNIRGERLFELADRDQRAGRYDIQFDGSDLSSGVYFYEMSAQSLVGSSRFHAVKKMMLVK